jgi:hypothetical protein
VEHKWQDWWQRQAMLLVVLEQDFENVAEHPQRHGRIDRALVLEKQV